MTDRRKFLTGMPAVAALGFATVAGSSAARAAAEVKAAATRRAANVIDPKLRDAFPSLPVTDQDGKSHQFYDSLIKDKIVVLNFMSIRDEAQFPITAKLSKLAGHLGGKLGRDVHMVSITRDPQRDTPENLKVFSEKFGAPKGWSFLTGIHQDMKDLSLRMYRMGHAHKPGRRKVDVVFYGNGSAGTWGAFPVDIEIDDMAERITWVMPSKRAEKMPHRAGPRVLNAINGSNNNREI